MSQQERYVKWHVAWVVRNSRYDDFFFIYFTERPTWYAHPSGLGISFWHGEVQWSRIDIEIIRAKYPAWMMPGGKSSIKKIMIAMEEV